MPLHISASSDFLDKVSMDDCPIEVIDQENVSLMNGHHLQKLSKLSSIRQHISVILAVGLALNFLILSYMLWNPQQWKHGSYELGFKTDFGAFHVNPFFDRPGPVRQEIALIDYHFTGSLHLDEHGVLQREIDPSAPQYAGEPSPEIDKSWDDLLSVMEVIVTGAEATEVAGKTTQGQEEGEWRMSLDVYHSIHCLNAVRKAIDPHYYNPDGKRKYYWRRHLDHCVDYIRQVIQCQADLTPLTYYYEPRYNTSIPIFGQPHTCRDFSRIHEWALKREGHILPSSQSDR